MKTRVAVILSVLVLLAGASSNAWAGPREEAVALVNKAAAYVKATGFPQALAVLNDPNGQFVKGDLYVFVWDYDGVVKAHPVTKGLVNKNVYTIKDPDGKEFVKEGIALAKSKGSGWVDYTWTHPATKKVAAKSSFVLNVPEYKIVLVCGIYK